MVWGESPEVLTMWAWGWNPFRQGANLSGGYPHEIGQHGQDDGEHQVQYQAGPHHLPLLDMAAGEDDGVGALPPAA